MNGINIKVGIKNLIKAKVKGGILTNANLKIGEAAPQMTLAIIKAKIGFINSFSYQDKTATGLKKYSTSSKRPKNRYCPKWRHPSANRPEYYARI